MTKPVLVIESAEVAKLQPGERAPLLNMLSPREVFSADFERALKCEATWEDLIDKDSP